MNDINFKSGIYHIPNYQDWVDLVDYLELRSLAGVNKDGCKKFWDVYENSFCAQIMIEDGRYVCRYSSFSYFINHNNTITSFNISMIGKNKLCVELI